MLSLIIVPYLRVTYEVSLFGFHNRSLHLLTPWFKPVWFILRLYRVT